MESISINLLAESLLTKERPLGIVLDAPVVIQQAVNAARFYATFGAIESKLPADALLGTDLSDASSPCFNSLPVPPTDWVDSSTKLSQHEWGIIKPLFMLYVERENAIYLEASRNLGVDVYGRTTSEIQNDIVQYEQIMPSLAFFQPIISI
ncbi:hypothetical protein [Undibacterium crateris]|uniref:hypothetical protein n=1 Tax=Undibacterium crateris TaxID=2528175 RepID=UPI00138A55B6|nr:hypothetical protein [Undibacterium crateris]NDI85060.1 hypothetical protein [Undibacterium crateris]